MTQRSSISERGRAIELLQRIDRESLFASIVLIGESGFVRTIVLGVLRWRSRLDWQIEQLAGRAIAKIDPIVADILRTGLYQIQFMNVPSYAAVSESVDVAAKRAARARGFVNAVLRKAASAIPEPDELATRLAHPRWLIDRWLKTYGVQRTTAIAEANQQLSYPDALTLSGAMPGGASPSQLVEGMVKLSGSSADLDRRGFYPMDEGSAVIASVAASTSKEVLDLAAAPGGKSIYMTTRGVRVVSSDISIARLRPLIDRSAILSSAVAPTEAPSPPRVVVADGRQTPFRRRFSTVLIDAPCSATGTIRKNPELKWRLRESDLPSFAALQRELLASALELADEFVVYSTCSLEPEENDAVVSEVLQGSPFERVDAATYAPAPVSRWIEEGVLRLTPDSGADGFTAFVLRRSR